jgi:hypothetical protein
LKEESLANSLRDELHKIGLGYIWQNGKDWDIRVTCQNIVNRCNDIDRQTKIERMREMTSFKCILGDE